MKKIYFCLFLTLFSLNIFAQHERRIIRSGNSSYEKGEYGNAAVKYEKALVENPESFEATYNLGNALYMQGNYQKADSVYSSLIYRNVSPELLSKAYFNLGNANLKLFMQQKDAATQQAMQQQANPQTGSATTPQTTQIDGKPLFKSIAAFKQALRINPKDFNAKYNLAYAKKLLADSQGGENQQNQENQENQESEENQENKQQEQQESQEQQQQQAEQSDEISEEDAKRLLEALQENEKDVHDKMEQHQRQKVKRVKIEKDW